MCDTLGSGKSAAARLVAVHNCTYCYGTIGYSFPNYYFLLGKKKNDKKKVETVRISSVLF